MKSKIENRRSVNIDKSDFDIIKKYCEDNALNMPKWMVLVCKEQIELHPDPFLECVSSHKNKGK